VKSVIQIMPLFFVPFILLAGFIINTKTLGIFSFLGYISPIKYGLELMMRAEFGQGALPNDKFEGLINQFGYDIGAWNCVIILLSLVVFFRVVACFQINRISKR